MSDAALPVDTDIDLHASRRRRHLATGGWLVLLVIATGGAAGAVARYGLGLAFPHEADEFPWGTFIANIGGCLLIGVLMVLITEVWSGHRLLRPFLGVGVLGGFTTFSAYVLEIRDLVAVRAFGTALGYLFGTLVLALVAVWLGAALTRLIARLRRRRR